MPEGRPRCSSDRYACIVEMKIDWDNRPTYWYRVCESPFFGRTRIAARRLALERVAALTWEQRPANRLRVKGIHIHELNC